MSRPVVMVDGLDEAREQAFSIAEELLIRLARHALVVVATRDLPGDAGGPGLVATLAPQGAGLDLDAPAVQGRGRDDVREYVASRLADTNDPRMDPLLVADEVAGAASMTASRPFLLARLVTDRLREVPIDTS